MSSDDNDEVYDGGDGDSNNDDANDVEKTGRFFITDMIVLTCPSPPKEFVSFLYYRLLNNTNTIPKPSCSSLKPCAPFLLFPACGLRWPACGLRWPSLAYELLQRCSRRYCSRRCSSRRRLLGVVTKAETTLFSHDAFKILWGVDLYKSTAARPTRRLHIA